MRTYAVLLTLFSAMAASGEPLQPTPAASNPKAEQAIARIPVEEIGSKALVMGELGVPIGETVSIAGVKKANGPIANYFWVDTINGKKLSGVRGIKVDGVAHWPNETRATLSGSEIGTIRFLSIKDGNFGSNDERFKPQQIIFLSFHAAKVVEPKNLKLEEK